MEVASAGSLEAALAGAPPEMPGTSGNRKMVDFGSLLQSVSDRWPAEDPELEGESAASTAPFTGPRKEPVELVSAALMAAMVQPPVPPSVAVQGKGGEMNGGTVAEGALDAIEGAVIASDKVGGGPAAASGAIVVARMGAGTDATAAHAKAAGLSESASTSPGGGEVLAFSAQPIGSQVVPAHVETSSGATLLRQEGNSVSPAFAKVAEEQAPNGVANLAADLSDLPTVGQTSPRMVQAAAGGETVALGYGEIDRLVERDVVRRSSAQDGNSSSRLETVPTVPEEMAAGMEGVTPYARGVFNTSTPEGVAASQVGVAAGVAESGGLTDGLPGLEVEAGRADVPADDAGNVFQQVLSHAARLSLPRDSSVRVHLTPPSLGVVDLHLKMVDRGLILQINVESPQTRDLIAAALPQLRQALESRSIEIDRMSLAASLLSGGANGGSGNSSSPFGPWGQGAMLGRQPSFRLTGDSSSAGGVVDDLRPSLDGRGTGSHLVDYRI